MKKINLTQSGAELADKTGVTTLSNPETAKVNKIKAIAAAVLLSLTPACGEAFTSGTSQPDGGVAGGGSGGAGAQAGGPVGGGNTGGIDGGNAGTGGIGLDGGGGNGGVTCDGNLIKLHGMDKYEYLITEDSCNGQIIATSLGNSVFETGTVNFCLPPGHIYNLTAQVKDPAHDNSLIMDLPDDSVLTSGVFTTLVTPDSMDAPMAYSICTATSGTLDCTDLNGDSTQYDCSGNPGGTPPPTSGFHITLNLN